jgi:hypothetical protein
MNPSIYPSRIDVRRLLIIVGVVLLIATGLLLALARFGPVVGEVRVAPPVNPVEAQQQLPFTIPQPQWLPEGLMLKGANVDPPNWVRIFYQFSDEREGGLSLETQHGIREGGYFFPENAKQSVMVKGQPAVCVQGTWNENGDWLAAADAGALEWLADGFFYHIGHAGLSLRCEDLIRIAESLRGPAPRKQ